MWCLVDDQHDVPASGTASAAKKEAKKKSQKVNRQGGNGAGDGVLAGEDKLGMWEGGEVGGFECYIEAEEDAVAEASDVFRMDDDDGPLLQVCILSLSFTCARALISLPPSLPPSLSY